MERTACDEEHVVRAHLAVLCVDEGSLDNREQVLLHTFARGFRATPGVTRRHNLVDLVDEDDSFLLRNLDGLLRNVVGVQELVHLELLEQGPRFPNFHGLGLRRLLSILPKDLVDLDDHVRHVLDRWSHARLEDVPEIAFLLVVRHLYRHLLVLDGAVPVKLSHGPPGLCVLFAAKKALQDLLLDIRRDLLLLDLLPPVAGQDHGSLHKLPHHLVHVPSVKPDFGELRGLHLDERGVRQGRKPPRDLGLAAARRTDH
mmetsp:Transcript_3130/g.8622  ORF Transcript_3130/g.8622 Transcript_3130/m.8622 type:complete len:257 (-) Transcript_3130:240-1010(-)